MSLWWFSYQEVSQEPEATSDQSVPPRTPTTSSARQCASLGFITQALLLATCATLFIGVVLMLTRPCRCPTSQTERTSIGDHVNTYHPVRFQLEYIHTPFRGPPSPEVDEAWASLIEDKYMIVPDADLGGINTSSHWPLRGSNEKDSGVWAKFEGFHALHCVNLLWKHTWPDYYVDEQSTLQHDPEPTHIHLDHCADLLRQMIQCNMDYSIITNYRKGTKVFADFDVLHQCQDFDAILEYTEDHRWSKKYQDRFEGYEENQRAIHEQASSPRLAGSTQTGSWTP